MKKIRGIIAVVMVVLIGMGWLSQISRTITLNKEYKAYIASAEEYMEQGLYQKAIDEYDKAYALTGKQKALKGKVEAYRSSYEEGTSTAKKYAAVLEEYCKVNEDDIEGWKMLLSLYLENANYKSAYAAINKCMDLGDKDKELKEMINNIVYSYKTSRKTYTEYYRSPDGYYTLYDDKNWGIMDTKGEWMYECEYQYAGPINQNLESLMVSSIGNRLFDEDGVTQAILSKYTVVTKAYGDGYIPMQNSNGKWQFYSCTDDKYVWEKYEDVTSFQGEKAFVYDGSKWICIGTDGKQIGKTKYDDVKIYGNGEYIYDDLFVASQDGKYYLFDDKGEKITKGSYKDMDVYLGEYIAYMDKDGKWGFIDDKGEVVIKAEYEQAKSFSNGLAAVSNGEKWGFINKDGDLVIDYQFRDADYFTEDGICFVSTYEDLYYMITLRFN